MIKRFFKQTVMPLGRWCHPEYNKNICSIDKQFIKSDYSTSDNCFSNSQKCKDNIQHPKFFKKEDSTFEFEKNNEENNPLSNNSKVHCHGDDLMIAYYLSMNIY